MGLISIHGLDSPDFPQVCPQCCSCRQIRRSYSQTASDLCFGMTIISHPTDALTTLCTEFWSEPSIKVPLSKVPSIILMSSSN